MATRTKSRKSSTGPRNAPTVVKESNEEMENLALSLARGLELAAEVKKLAGNAGDKPSRKALKKIQAIAESVAAAAPPPLSPETQA